MTRKTVALALACSMTLAAFSARASDICDRPCLQGLVDRYLEALVAHDPERLPLAQGVRFTEDGQELRLGDGLWATASAPGRYKLYVTDPADGQVGFFGTVFENGVPVLLALRLKVDYGLVSQIETIVARPAALGSSGFPGAGAEMERRGHPRPQFLEVIPNAERMSRANLVRIANSYFTGLAGDTGRNTAPFWPSCNRLENGTQTTNNPTLRPNSPFNVIALGCEAQQQSGFYPFVTTIRNRRFPVVDREHGLVLSFAFFEHRGALKTIHLTNGMTIPSPVKAPLTLEIAELFQIHGGKIDQIEAVINTVPYGMKSAVWDEPHVEEAPDANLAPHAP
ncbi:MAG TPA: hypothetical protein VMD49_10360 [Steroidobacteraceae bacterium]|jgi:hypothetical protein|nr:hypothetical protein [Steroidobacteraceae bacterium]